MASCSFRHADFLIVGQGLAGSAMAWHLSWLGASIVVVDREDPVTASSVAAGLLTPVTGMRLIRSPDYERDYHAAANFYRKVESLTASRFFEEPETIRLFQSDDEKERFLRHHRVGVQNVRWAATSTDGNASPVDGFRMTPAGRLNVPVFLKATRQWLQQTNSCITCDLAVDSALQFEDTQVRIPLLELTVGRVILCQGYSPLHNNWFPEVPDSPARGDLLTVRIRGLNETRIVHRGIWLVPLGGDLYQIGSTYDWLDLSCTPSNSGRNELLARLAQFIPQEVEVVSHQAAVRPAMRNHRPVARIHPDQPCIAILNGLGAKGSLRAPQIAAELSRQLVVFGPKPAERTLMSPERPRSPRISLTRHVHQLLQEVICPGDTVIDATAGNGHDTLFLALAVGPTGRVLAYDIQATALEITRQKLVEAGMKNVELRNQSHTELNQCGERFASIAAITFNLGYLPGGDKSLTTHGAASTAAVRAGIPFLRLGGLMTIIAYRGHAGGLEECEAIERCASDLPATEFEILTTLADPGNRESPKLFQIRRLTVSR